MLANTLHNKSQKEKAKNKKQKLKTAHTILLPNPGKLITYSDKQKGNYHKHPSTNSFLTRPTPSPTQKMQTQITMASKEAQITRWVALRIARERIKDKITTTKDEEE
jgi:hypothetical protein